MRIRSILGILASSVAAGATLATAACSSGPGAAPSAGVPTPSTPSGPFQEADAGTIGSSPVPTLDAGMPIPPGPESSHPIYGPTTTLAVPPPPLSGGTLVVATDGSTVYAADPDRDSLYIVSLAGPVVRSVALQPGDEPGRVALDAAGRVHVVLRGAGAVAAIDPTSGSVLSRTAVCARPRGLAYSAANDSMLVACASGELITLPAAGGAATRTVVLEPDLHDVVMVGSTPVVSTFRTADLVQIAADGTIASHFAKPPTADAPGVAWRMIPTPTGVAVAMQLASPSAVAPVAGGYGSGGCMGAVTNPAVSTWSSDGTWVGAAAVSGALPVDVALSPDGTTYAVVLPGEWRMPGSMQLALTTVSPGEIPSSAGTVGVAIPVPPSAAVDASVDDAGGVPVGIPSPPSSPVCGEPTTIAGQAVAVAFLPSSAIVVQTREPATLQVITLADLATVQTISLSSVSRDDTGHEVFHSDQGGGIACASCHPEGGEDGRVWQFTDVGARRTPSALGTLAGTAPYHWDGSQIDLPTLYHGSLERMNGVDLTTDEVTAFSAWLTALPGPRPVAGDAAAAARGLALFQNDGGCATCHSGPKLTNNQTMDVGTGAPMQVPPLIGVSWRAPFLHNGCAATLTDAIGACGNVATHGTTSGFTAAQLSDLVAYLQTL